MRENRIACPTAVTVGKFDGLHRGHDLLAHRILEQKGRGLSSVVVTFDASPRVVLQGQKNRSLVTREEKKYLLERDGIEYLAECSFEDEIVHMEPEEFIRLLKDNFSMKYLAVGTDFHFGYRGRGDVDLLRRLAGEMGFDWKWWKNPGGQPGDQQYLYPGGDPERSYKKRANHLLGYPYFACGTVVHGKHLGSRLGFATINITPPPEKLLPPFGVYVTQVRIDGRTYRGVTNVGVKPTIEGERLPGIETHIFDFPGNFTGSACVSPFSIFCARNRNFPLWGRFAARWRRTSRGLWRILSPVDRAMESRGAMKKNEAGNEINFCLQSHIPMLYFVSMKLPVFGLTDTPTSG